ncbi:MAG: hypothetical protein ABIW82_17765 [Dokdonella sp.]
MKCAIWFAGFVLTTSVAGHTQTLPPMHDHEAVERLGSVHFATSCSREAQVHFDRAVALMHSFQFGSAIDGFRSALAVDPGCAIADWGIALSSWSNPFAGFKSPAQLAQGLQAVNQGRAAAPKTKRERDYIEAVAELYTDTEHRKQPARARAYEVAMGQVAKAYPEDNEASIFYALALAAAADPSDKTYAKQLKAGAMLERLFAKYPDHPGLAHYIIHAYDEPALASRADEAARRYAQIAPSTPHALHMPSHTFTRIGEWQASIDTNLASAAAARAANQPADELHASDYMVYAYLQTAQEHAAKHWVDVAAETFSRFDPDKANGAAPASAAYFAHAAIPARDCLERRDWACAAKLEAVPSKFSFADAVTYFAQGLGAAHIGDAVGARAAIASLNQIHETLDAKGEAYWAGQIDIQRRGVMATLAFAQHNFADALAGMRAAADLEDKSGLSSVTPGPLVPAREMLGGMLLSLKRPGDALKEFKAALVQTPNRFWSLYGAAEAAKMAGDHAEAREYFSKLLVVAQRADRPRRKELVEADEETRR